MRVPANAIAETIKQLEIQNESLENQIAYVQDLLNKNNSTLQQLEPLAEWTEEPDPTPLDFASTVS